MERNGSLLAPGLAAQPAFPLSTLPTDREAQCLVVPGINGLALLCTAARAAAAFGLSLEGNPAQLKEDVPLGLLGTRGTVSLASGSSRTPAPKAAWGYRAPHLVAGVHFCHHPLLPEVESQDLQHVQLVGHLAFDGAVPSDDVLCGGVCEDGQQEQPPPPHSCQLAQTAVAATLPTKSKQKPARASCLAGL